MRFEFLTPGKRVKKIRKELRMTQEEIGHGKSRNLISDIENEKIELTYGMALTIITNANNKINENNIDRDLLTFQDLMKSEEMQVIDFISNVIDNIKNDDIGSLEETDETIDYTVKLIQEYKIENEYMLELLKEATNYCYNQNEYTKSKTYAVKSIHIAGVLGKTFDALECVLLVAKIYVAERGYDQAVQYNNYAKYIMDTNNIKNDKYEIKILFNNALCYIKTDKINEALLLYQELKKYKLDKVILYNARINEATCYRKKRMYDKAKEIYNKMKLENTDKKSLVTIHFNLAKIYIEENNLKQAKNEYEISINNAVKTNNNRLNEVMYEYALLERKNKNIKHAKQLLEKSIKYKNAKTDWYLELLKIYIEEKNDKAIDDLLGYIENKNNIEDINVIFMQVISYYMESNFIKSTMLVKKLNEIVINNYSDKINV